LRVDLRSCSLFGLLGTAWDREANAILPRKFSVNIFSDLTKQIPACRPDTRSASAIAGNTSCGFFLAALFAGRDVFRREVLHIDRREGLLTSGTGLGIGVEATPPVGFHLEKVEYGLIR